MAIAIVEELWTRIRAAIDDKIVAAEAAADSAEADRVVVEQAATSASWSGDRLTVLGATSPPLTGPQGPEGPKGDSGDGAGDVLWSELNPVLDGKASVSHDHTITQVTGLQDELDGKADSGHQHSWGDVTGKPSAYPPESHSHTASQISDATTVGRNVLKASSQSAARSAIGAGTSNLALGTTSSTAAAGNHTHSQYATTTQMEARTPEIRIVSTIPTSPTPGVVYMRFG